MVRSRTPSQGGGSQGFEMERKYSVPSNPESRAFSGSASEDLHAWSIYRQNLNSDFTDSALGSTDKSPLPYGNFQLRDTTVQSILSHPRYGPKSALGSNMYTYLKFGLPRVFPPNQNGSNRSATPQHFTRNTASRPTHKRLQKSAGSRGLRDGSSGYDSSDNETSNHYKQNRKYRSDPDFRMQNVHSSYQGHPPHPPAGGVPLAAMQQGGIRRSPQQWPRPHRSVSEANLLHADYERSCHSQLSPNPAHMSRPDPRRNSVAEFGHYHHHDHHHHVVDHSVIGSPGPGRPMSKTESHLSVPASRRGPSVIRNDYIIQEDDLNGAFLYPHLQVHSVSLHPPSFFPSRHLLLTDISLEAHGAELLAVMATQEQEGTVLLELLAGLTRPVTGEVLLNGRIMSPKQLRRRVAYVQRDDALCPDMTALQMLRYQYDLCRPTDRLGYLKIDAMDRINVLIEDLGLEQVRNTKVSAMTISERRRLIVACHLLLDTDVVVLDQPTKGMDIFDTFFLIEYLRQWANGGAGNSLGRIVILTLHPPTYEIFTMLSRILLISAGRTMFSGKRRDMLPYFALVDYPCPSFKNPSDYYLDLVTLDDLSAEAMLESSQRIEQLAEVFRQKQEPMSDPGPPATLPLSVKNSNFIMQALVIFTKAMFYTQPHTFITWLTLIIMSASLSLLTGAIFWDVPSSDQQLLLNDRLGYHYAVMAVLSWPLLLALVLMEARRNRRVVERDIRDGLYGRLVYIVTKVIINLPASLFVWLIFLVPSYSMSGLYMQSTNNYDGFYIYIGVMLLYYSCMQILLTFAIHLLPSYDLATILASLAMNASFLTSGFLVHYKDLPVYVKFLEYVSPLTWLMPYLLNKELSQEAIASSSASLLCKNKQVTRQDIIVQLPCPPPNGTQVLENFGYLQSQQKFYDYGDAPLALGVFYGVFFVLTCVVFMVGHRRNRSKHPGKNNANKP